MRCNTCGTRLVWAKKFSRYYCPSCKSYAPKELWQHEDATIMPYLAAFLFIVAFFLLMAGWIMAENAEYELDYHSDADLKTLYALEDQLTLAGKMWNGGTVMMAFGGVFISIAFIRHAL